MDQVVITLFLVIVVTTFNEGLKAGSVCWLQRFHMIKVKALDIICID
jgi:hypothetical protein